MNKLKHVNFISSLIISLGIILGALIGIIQWAIKIDVATSSNSQDIDLLKRNDAQQEKDLSTLKQESYDHEHDIREIENKMREIEKGAANGD